MNLEAKHGALEVSVLMSCYNGARWLHEAVGSVLAQSFRDFELLLVDDGSKDNTLELVRAYAAKDSRVKVLAKPNSGLADSLNAGLALAKGKWIARVDQDDICEPDRLARQLAFVKRHPGLILLGSGFVEINEAGDILKKHCYPSSHDALVRRLERLQGFFPHSSAFYLADAVRKSGGYNVRFTRAEDWRLWLELSLQGEVSCLPEALVRIRKHAGQMSLDNNGARQFCDAAAATVCHFLSRKGVQDPSGNPDKEAWDSFLNWVDAKLAGNGALARRCAWGKARCAFFASGSGGLGAVKCVWSLLMSGYAVELLIEKFYGSRLPAKLAQEWEQQINKCINKASC